MDQDIHQRVDKLEQNTSKLFKVVFEKMDSYEEMATPRLPSRRKKIGLKD